MASIINTKNLTIAKNLLDNRIIRKENIFPKRKFKSEADCYKCGRIGHYANKYYTKRKLKEFQIDEDLKLQLLLNFDASSSSGPEYKIDNELDYKSDSSSSSPSSPKHCSDQCFED